MDRREKLILLGVLVVLGVGGAASFRFQGSSTLSVGGSSVDGAAQAINAALRRGLANSTPGATAKNAAQNYGDWSSPRWNIDVTPLRLNHPLHRRPKHIGENRHHVMQGGWNDWYYNPPSEAYF